jgi:gluconate kinase
MLSPTGDFLLEYCCPAPTGGFFIYLYIINMILILFGPPGVGKSFVGNLFAARCGLELYDGDTDYTPEEKQLISTGEWNDKHRQVFLERIAGKIGNLESHTQTGILVPIAMTRQWMRDLFDRQFKGQASWVLVKPQISHSQLKDKVTARSKEGHMISPDTFERLTAQFEAPTMPHFTLENPHTREGNSLLEKQIDIIWSQINTSS